MDRLASSLPQSETLNRCFNSDLFPFSGVLFCLWGPLSKLHLFSLVPLTVWSSHWVHVCDPRPHFYFLGSSLCPHGSTASALPRLLVLDQSLFSVACTSVTTGLSLNISFFSISVQYTPFGSLLCFQSCCVVPSFTNSLIFFFNDQFLHACWVRRCQSNSG